MSEYVDTIRQQEHEQDLQRLRGLKPIDDDFMQQLFRENRPLAEKVLKIITGTKLPDTAFGDCKMNKAAIILCAGKGTRMNDDSRNKVCFDCAGVPVIKRIISNMRLGGISLFIIVVGHLSETVMNCLSEEPGVLYAYQKEQKGTGHAALCGLKALQGIGYTGSAIISMGDKIIAPNVIHALLEKRKTPCGAYSL